MEQSREYRTAGGLTVTRLQPEIGALVSGLNLSESLGEELIRDLRQALYSHGVIFLRGQEHIGFAEHLALAQAFGAPINDGPDPVRPMITPVQSRAGNRKGTASVWHADGCYLSVPPSVSVLRAIEPCMFGGDTCFASSTAAYANLPDDVRQEIVSLTFRSSLAERMPKNNDTFGTAEKWDALRSKFPPVHQPVVSVHPETGARALYANVAWSIDIDGMTPEDGRALIRRLAEEYSRPEFQVRWQWESGAIAIWDNRLVMHYGVPNQTTDRYLERISVTDGPILSAADWEASQVTLQAVTA